MTLVKIVYLIWTKNDQKSFKKDLTDSKCRDNSTYVLFNQEANMTPYKMHSLVRRKGDRTIFMVTNRRIMKDHNKGYYIKYVIVEPHDPFYHKYADHCELIPLGAS